LLTDNLAEAAAGNGPLIHQIETHRRDTIGAALACLERVRAIAAHDARSRVSKPEGQKLCSMTGGQWDILVGNWSTEVLDLWPLAQWVTVEDTRRWLGIRFREAMAPFMDSCGIVAKEVPWRGNRPCILFDDALLLMKRRKIERLACDIGMSTHMEVLWQLFLAEGPQRVALLAASLYRNTAQEKVWSRHDEGTLPRHADGRQRRHVDPLGYPKRRLGQNRRSLREYNEELVKGGRPEEVLTEAEIEEEVQRREGLHQMEELRQALTAVDFEALMAKIDESTTPE
jgi:hypothetical protein